MKLGFHLIMFFFYLYSMIGESTDVEHGFDSVNAYT